METSTAMFINIPALRIAPEPEQWILDGKLSYQSAQLGDDGKPVLVEIEKGFQTDLASIPRIPLLRFLFIKNGRHRLAAIPHDFLCRMGLDFSRVTADKIFLEAMKICKVPRLRRRLMYWAVRINTSRLKLMRKAR